MRPRGDGLFDLVAAPIDSVVVRTLPVEVEFEVAIHLRGPELDFETRHVVEVVLTGPDLREDGRLQIPVGVRVPGPNHIPGYEIHANLVARIVFYPDREGGYDLSFALDGVPDHNRKATISVVLANGPGGGA